jgi:hypothetical protein
MLPGPRKTLWTDPEAAGRFRPFIAKKKISMSTKTCPATKKQTDIGRILTVKGRAILFRRTTQVARFTVQGFKVPFSSPECISDAYLQEKCQLS